MKLVISDVDNLPFSSSEDTVVIKDNGKIHNCIGCFGCWVKNPGQCLIKDGYEDMGKKLSICSELILISKCTYGSLSPFVKNVLDRGISYIHPNFVIRNGEMHHKRRYKNIIKITAYFYGEDISDLEKETAEKLILANSVNFDGIVKEVVFLNNVDELRGDSF
ncbi:MAG: flavodoxin family protein [Clostridiales bacterium]|nr:flavodoxin family protein [Clostridiales bacterium]